MSGHWRDALEATAEQESLASWFMGGFEGSTLKFADGRRVDMVAATGHDRHCVADYHHLAGLGIRTVRDTLRWHLVEPRAGVVDTSSARAMFEAADAAGTQVIWDLCHYGTPDHVEVLDPTFPEQFADFAGAMADLHASVTDATPWWCPVNEISYWAYAAGTHGYMWPAQVGRADEIKAQLVRATLAAVERLRAVDSRARFLHVDPLSYVTDVDGPSPASGAEREAGYAAWDMIEGRLHPELGGAPDALDWVGVNYYPSNQWLTGSRIPVSMGARHYRPLRLLLRDVWERYRRPIVISETGAETPSGPGWLRYVAGEARAAMRAGVPIMGLCIYPVMDYPAWVDAYHCGCGLIRVDDGVRSTHEEMAEALEAEMRLMPEHVAGVTTTAA